LTVSAYAVLAMDAKTIEIKLNAGELITLDAESLHVRSAAYNTFCLICDKQETYTC